MPRILPKQNKFLCSMKKYKSKKKKNSFFKKGRLRLRNLRKKIFKCFPHTYENQLLDYGRVIGTNQCLCQDKAELSTKTAAQLSSGEVCRVQPN